MHPIKIVVCGDFRAANPEKIKLSDEVVEVFSDADVRICNFEAPVHVEGVKPIKKSGPSLDQSPQSPLILKKIGFNVILLANNHIMDYGEAGLFSTLKSFDSVTTIGAGKAVEAYKVKYIEVNGVRIGLLSLVHREYGVVEKKNDKCGAAWMCSPDVPEIIMDAKTKCDRVLVFPHAGVEHTAAPLPEIRELYKKYIDWGADLVVASHPHCPQGWEMYGDKYVYYSLGNFYFDELHYDDLWNKSIVLEIIIDSKINVKEHYIYFDEKTGIVCFDRSSHIKEYINYVNTLISDKEEYEKYIEKISESHWIEYKYYLLRGVRGISINMPLKMVLRLVGSVLLERTNPLGINNIFQCESHRWLAENYFKKLIKE